MPCLALLCCAVTSLHVGHLSHCPGSHSRVMADKMLQQPQLMVGSGTSLAEARYYSRACAGYEGHAGAAQEGYLQSVVCIQQEADHMPKVPGLLGLLVGCARKRPPATVCMSFRLRLCQMPEAAVQFTGRHNERSTTKCW